MKKCPQCGREYDLSMSFCLDDGAELLYGPATADEPHTAILQASAPSSEAATRTQLYTTEAEPQPTFDNTSERPSLSAHRAAEQPASSVKRLLLASVALAVIVLGGFYGYRYFNSTNQIRSIAVMPFVNESGNADVEYLSDGMTETLISSLSRLPALNVKPRSLVFRYKGKELDLQAVGKELGVEAVLSGRVSPRGQDISLFVELIDVASTKVLWSRQYSRKQSELVSLQSEIARDVSSNLKTELSGDEEKRVTENGTSNPEAYRLYLLARSFAERRKEKDIRKALESYEQAVALDPNYAQAYLGLAAAHQFTAIYGSVPANEALPKARVALLRALEIAPELSPVHVGLASTKLFMERDFAGSEREIIKALELDPKSSAAHRVNGMRLAFLGHLDEAAAELRKAIDLEPTNATARVNYSWTLFYSGRLNESDAALKSAQELDATFWFIEFQLFVNARGRRDFSAAMEHLARAQDLRDEPEAAKLIRDSFRSGGWNGMMRAVITDPGRAKVWDYYIATFAAELGEKDTAFAFLNKAADKYDQFVLFAKIDPAMEPLRVDTRYVELLKKLGLQ